MITHISIVLHKYQTENKDEELIADYQKSGKLEVLGELFEPYMPLVYGVCLKYLKEKEESEDAVMQVFEQLIDKLKNHEVKNFKSWLYVLSRNHCLMELRKNKRLEMVSIDERFMENESTFHHEDNSNKELQLKLMEKCLETLVLEQKLSIDLFYLQKKCYQEVAEKTGFELNKVKSYIQNGKRNLKICMEKNLE